MPGLPAFARELQMKLMHFICYLVEDLNYMNMYVHDKGLSVLLHRETHPNEATTNESTALCGVPCLSSFEDEMK